MNLQLRIIFLSAILVFAFSAPSFSQDLNQTDAKGLKQGKWKKLYSNERVRYEGQFKDDKPYGLFQYYYETGQLQATNNHIGNGKVANHVYHPNGKIKAKGVFREQKKDSLWQYFNENELLVLEETYILDTLNGAQKTYYENKQLGEETNFSHGVKEGVWKKFFDNGKPWVDANYVNGNLDGKFVMFREDGKRKVQGTYALGFRVGTWLNFNENGSVYTQQVYKNGVLKTTKPENGEFKEYYDSEIPKSVYNYKKGQKEGEFQEFYNVGEWTFEETPGKMDGPDEITQQLVGTQVKMKGWYHEDQLNGKVTYYNEDGSTQRVEVWENGTLISTIDWEPKGNE
jgi:antitoxin component YwqK of YwqJK toxin-antitoxin module